MESIKKQTKYFIAYYLFLLLVFISWQNYDSVPNGGLRIGYLIAVVAPLYVYSLKAFPAIITLFYTIALFGFTTSYMPARDYTYIAATIIAAALAIKKTHQHVPICVLVIFFIVSFVNITHDVSWESVSSAFLLLSLFFLIVDNNYEKQTVFLTYSFIVASLILSLYYIIIGSQFVFDYRLDEGLERVGFADINYGGTIVGMGIFAALIELFRKRNLTILQKILIGLTIAFSVLALVRNASRGAVLAVSASAAVLILFSKVKTKYKITILLLLAIFVYFLYTNSYMDLLLYRVENDEIGGGSGRTEIWTTKLDSFFSKAKPYEWLLGMGFSGGRHLGWGMEQRAFHNDFIAFFVDYGIIGFVAFLSFFFRPLKKIKVNKSIVIAGVVFLLVSCITLEPFTAGRFPFFVFWFYLFQFSRQGLMDRKMM